MIDRKPPLTSDPWIMGGLTGMALLLLLAGCGMGHDALTFALDLLSRWSTP